MLTLYSAPCLTSFSVCLFGQSLFSPLSEHAFTSPLSSLPVSDVNSATPQQRAFFHCTRSFSFAYGFFNRVDEFVQYLWAYVPDGTLALCQQIQGILMHFYSALSSMVLRSEEVLYA